MLTNLSPLLIVVLAFGAVAIAVFALGQLIATQAHVHQRLAPQTSDRTSSLASNFDSFVSTYFQEQRFGVTREMRAKLRRELIRAGFFHPQAINYYIFARLAAIIVLPTLAYFATQQLLVNSEWYLKFGLVGVVILLAAIGPDAYIARRTRTLQQEFRVVFPDMLDLMVVCVDAGLSMEAALDRISTQIANQSRPLGTNLQIFGAEMRAGRSTIDALDSLADRLGLNETAAFAAMLRQSVELGTDVGEALRAFSDDMRDRRLLRAEERANQLPVKLVAPLGLCIFPVILLLVMLPIVLRLIAVLV